MSTNSKSSSDMTFDINFDPEIANEIFDIGPLKEDEIKEEKQEEEEEEEVDEDEECKEISERVESLSMEKWLSLTKTLDKSNSESLEEEASVTLPSIENFINALESYAKMTGRNKPYRRRYNPESNVSVAVEKAFQERISLGMFIMSRITELMRLEKLDCNIFPFGSSNDLRRVGSIGKFEPQLKMLVARFARILELGGIKHNIQVCPIARSALLLEEQPKRKPLQEEMSVIDIMKPMVFPEEIKEEIIPEKEKETSNPVEFLKRIVSKYYLSLSFNENPSKLKTKGHEFYSICELENHSASALGSDRIEARNNSASKMIATLIVEHKKGKSISENKYTTLTEEEMIKALKILCQTEDYDRQLKEICDEHTAHPPIYKAIRETPMYVIECQALGYKGKGSHTDLTIAKRIAARKVLDVMPKEGILAKHHSSHVPEHKQRNKTFIIKPSSSYRRRFMAKIK